MSYNEAETRYYLIDPVLREKGYDSHQWLKLETPAPVEPTGPKGKRRKGSGRTDYLLCVQVGDMPKSLPVAVLEAKKETDDPLKGMQQAKGYIDRYDVKYVFATNGHRYGEYDKFTGLQAGPHPFVDFLAHPDLTARYSKDTGIDVTLPEAKKLFMPDSAAYPDSRYYQDAAIRAAFEKIIHCRQNGEPARVLLSLVTGAGKTIIAANLLWRLHEAEDLPKPALFLCDRDELREQAYNKLSAVFGDNARIVKTEKSLNAARNARIHIATYQTLGLDDDTEEEKIASFLTDFYPLDAFSVIIIDECHRSAWGRWSEVLKRNPNAIHIGLTATPRQLREAKKITSEDEEITANNRKYFGEPVYEYTLIQAQEDGYLAACEIVKRKPSIDSKIFTREEILAAKPLDIRTGKPITAEDLTKSQYSGKDFDNELFIDMRTPAMCQDLFTLLCQNGGPEQKVIIFCTREIQADRVAMRMNNLYATWCREQGSTPKEHYAFKCMGGKNNGSDMIEPMRGSGERAFIACTVDLLEAGVDIERLNAVVFFRYLESPIKFYQMVGRGTRIHEETSKYKFWLYDYTGVTDLFGTDFITDPPRPGGSSSGGGTGGGDGGGDGGDPPAVAELSGHFVSITPQGRFILCSRDGRDVPIPVDEYRRDMVARVLQEAHTLNEFRQLWVETQKRRQLVKHLLESNLSPELIREIDQMNDCDMYDVFVHHGYRASAFKRSERNWLYLDNNRRWFEEANPKAATVLMELGHQFEIGGTEALETPALWDVPEIKLVGGFDALKSLGKPPLVMHEAKMRLFT
ncbi:MAG TPA: DEAD/DEAH box helicase family protein [Desulfuromonadales bacterium]|nr:DEAD/DEAH box helicase family protein [Desulfuromonadales bacterium]